MLVWRLKLPETWRESRKDSPLMNENIAEPTDVRFSSLQTGQHSSSSRSRFRCERCLFVLILRRTKHSNARTNSATDAWDGTVPESSDVVVFLATRLALSEDDAAVVRVAPLCDASDGWEGHVVRVGRCADDAARTEDRARGSRRWNEREWCLLNCTAWNTHTHMYIVVALKHWHPQKCCASAQKD